MAERSWIYQDPSKSVDTLQRAESMVNNCPRCRHYEGEAWEMVICSRGKQKDKDGFCYYWRKADEL